MNYMILALLTACSFPVSEPVKTGYLLVTCRIDMEEECKKTIETNCPQHTDVERSDDGKFVTYTVTCPPKRRTSNGK